MMKPDNSNGRSDGNLPAPSNLAAKQERVAQDIVFGHAGKGMNQSDAYRNNYDCSDMKPETVWNPASVLVNQDKVKARIQQLRDQITAGAAWDCGKSRRRLLGLGRRSNTQRPTEARSKR